MNSAELIKRIVRNQARGKPDGIYSICSSHPYVIEASLLQAQRDGSMVLVESTSNQVNQFGGYTGMTPADFARFVISAARRIGFPAARVILGGDHLGPIPFRNESAQSAMEKACTMVEQFVKAGFVKIHLDASVPLAEESRVEPALIAERCARLCRVCEETHSDMIGTGSGARVPAPLYVIGTEVPVPGGSDAVEEGIEVTSVSDFEETVSVTGDVFYSHGLQEAWERVVAVVVQPGVEFGDHTVIPYSRDKAKGLSMKIREHRNIVFEAHSTDYQSAESLKQMVEDGYAILKVGPALTYAFREGVFLLKCIEDELFQRYHDFEPSDFMATVDTVMKNNPLQWEKYYKGSDDEISFKRKYSYFDRIRYYWPDKKVHESLMKLIKNLREREIPLTLLSQFFPVQYRKVRNGLLLNDPEDLLRGRVMDIISDYSYAVGFRNVRRVS